MEGQRGCFSLDIKELPSLPTALQALCWVLLQHDRVDAMYAYNTYKVYSIAETSLNTSYNQIDTEEQLGNFLEDGIASARASPKPCSPLRRLPGTPRLTLAWYGAGDARDGEDGPKRHLPRL